MLLGIFYGFSDTFLAHFLPLTRFFAGCTVLCAVLVFFAVYAGGIVAVRSHLESRLGGDRDGILLEMLDTVRFTVGSPFAALDEARFGLGVVHGAGGKEAKAASDTSAKKPISQ